jgi:F0F1-type ATP synthase membrane subunit b/b'
MPILKRIVLVLCFHILSVCALPTNSCYSAVLSPSAVLLLRGELHGRLKPEQGSTPLVSETAVSKNSEIAPAHDMYKELTDSHSVRRLAHWAGLSSTATFHLCSAFNFLLLVAFIYWKGCPRLTAALRARTNLIRRTIEEAHHLSEEARQRLADIESRWVRLDSEIASIRAVAEAGMKNEELHWWAATEAANRRILENAEREIEAAVQRAQHEVRAFTADLAVCVARQAMHIDERTDRCLIRAFVKELGQSVGIGERLSHSRQPSELRAANGSENARKNVGRSLKNESCGRSELCPSLLLLHGLHENGDSRDRQLVIASSDHDQGRQQTDSSTSRPRRSI